jgi:23S rRNA-/tRNA-specific pseudouridylate synthase
MILRAGLMPVCLYGDVIDHRNAVEGNRLRGCFCGVAAQFRKYVHWFEDAPETAMTSPIILRDGSGVIAVLKPVGLATQAPPGIESVERWLRGRLGRDAAGYLGVPHRLDRAVSGVVLMAATPRAARKLSRQFERREIVKTYLAVVASDSEAVKLDHPAAVAEQVPAAETVVWRDFLRKLPEEARSEIVEPESPQSREAVTQVSCIDCRSTTGGRRLLHLVPLTGRMHQLRLQAASRGLPIVGDELYGGPPLGEGDARERPILLHAWRIAYADPDSGERVTIDAPLPDHWPAWARPD